MSAPREGDDLRLGVQVMNATAFPMKTGDRGQPARQTVAKRSREALNELAVEHVLSAAPVTGESFPVLGTNAYSTAQTTNFSSRQEITPETKRIKLLGTNRQQTPPCQAERLCN